MRPLHVLDISCLVEKKRRLLKGGDRLHQFVQSRSETCMSVTHRIHREATLVCQYNTGYIQRRHLYVSITRDTSRGDTCMSVKHGIHLEATIVCQYNAGNIERRQMCVSRKQETSRSDTCVSVKDRKHREATHCQ